MSPRRLSLQPWVVTLWALALLVPVLQTVAGATQGVMPVRQIGGPGHAEVYPWGLATQTDGSVLMTDYWNFRVVRYLADGTAAGTLVGNRGNGPTQHQAPYSIAVDPRNGDFYFGDVDGGQQVHKHDRDGNHLLTFGGPDVFAYPGYLAVSRSGTVYVGDRLRNEVVAFDPDGTELFRFGASGSGPGKLLDPRGVAVDLLGRVYVVDNGNRRVQVFSSDGGHLSTFGESVFPDQRDLRGIAVDPLLGLVYVVEAAAGQVHQFTLLGTHARSWGSLGDGPGQFVGGGRGITVDHEHNIWVADMPGFRAQKFNLLGQLLLTVPDPPRPPEAGRFNQPRGVALDAAGNIFVSDTHNWRIIKFSPDGTPRGAWGTRGGGPSAFNYARGIAVDAKDGSVIVADTDNHQIKKFDNDGSFLWRTSSAMLRNPHAVAVGPEGHIYVADTGNRRVLALGPHGTPLFSFGSSGSGPGQFLSPRGVAVDPEGGVWVADAERRVVQQFSQHGTYLGRVGEPGSASHQLAFPSGVAVNEAHVFVSDVTSNAIKVWTREGSFVGSYGGTGGELGQFRRPHGLALTPDDRLYVVEQAGGRVQELDVSGLPGTTSEADSPSVRIDHPVADQDVPFGPVSIEGAASSHAGVKRVAIAIHDPGTRSWWQPEGGWGQWALLDVEMAEPGATTTAWSHIWTPPQAGTYGLTVRVFDEAGNQLAKPPWQRFHVAQ